MPEPVKLAFERQIVLVPTESVLPLRKVSELTRNTVKFRRIAASVKEIGIIEPLIVAQAKNSSGIYLLLDGHMRYAALVDLGATQLRCLIAADDEAFTYNKRINRLATIQEHYMIVRALERGVSEEKLAKALDVDVQSIRRRRTLLDAICNEVIDLFKDKIVSPVAFNILRKMKPARQIEAAELMAASGNYSTSYARALLAATRQYDLVNPDRPKRVAGMTHEQMARMEREMETLQRDFKAVEASYGDDVLHLVIASGYLSKLVSNPEIERYLQRRHPELIEEFRSIIVATSLDQPSLAA
jgi:ParB-like chromosome segregation protein Spo0J